MNTQNRILWEEDMDIALKKATENGIPVFVDRFNPE